MKFNIKTLCSVGALLLCSENASAATIIQSKYTGRDQVSVQIKGRILKEDLPVISNVLSNPLVTVRSLTLRDNQLEELTPEIKDQLKNLRGLISFSIQNNKFEEIPEEIMKWFPRLKRIYYWNNPIRKSPDFLLYMGSLEVISGSYFARNTRDGVNTERQWMTNRYEKKIENIEDLLRMGKEELSALQKQLNLLKERELYLENVEASKRQKKFVRRRVNKSAKALAQKKEKLTNLLEEITSLKEVLDRLNTAQRISLDIAEKEKSR